MIKSLYSWEDHGIGVLEQRFGSDREEHVELCQSFKFDKGWGCFT